MGEAEGRRAELAERRCAEAEAARREAEAGAQAAAQAAAEAGTALAAAESERERFRHIARECKRARDEARVGQDAHTIGPLL